MNPHFRPLFGLLAWLPGVAHALTDEDVFETTLKSPEELPEEESELSAEVGGNAVSGNTATSTIYARISAGQKWKWNGVSGEAHAELGRSITDADGDGTLSEEERETGYLRTAEEFGFDGRYDRFITTRDSVYSIMGWLHSPFSGYESRIHGQLGYSRGLVQTDQDDVRGELGFDVALENYTEGVVPSTDMLYAGRGYLGWTAILSESLIFEEEVEAFVNVEFFEDIRFINETSLSVSPNSVFSVKTSYLIEHDTHPVDGYRKTDQTVALTLVASLIAS